MIKPTFNRLSDAFWKHYIHHIISSDFHEHTIQPKALPVSQGKSVLVLANHFSWWDGFFIYELNQKYFKKRFHVMMLEDQLKKNSFLRSAGAYSINKNDPRKSIESLAYSAELLENPKNLVLMFPQGQIESNHAHQLTFQKGVKRIISDRKPMEVIFCINLTDYQSNRKPTLYSYLEKYEGRFEVGELESSFHEFYAKCKEKQSSMVS